MNCLEKMYKEIDEIINKEKQEHLKMAVPIKEIKQGFVGFDDKDETAPLTEIDYLSRAVYDENISEKKYFNEDKAKIFIEFIFKKFLCFNATDESAKAFAFSVKDKFDPSLDLLQNLNKLESEFVNIVGASEEVEKYFTNPYNALYKDNDGYFAVILNGKFSDVKRPCGFNPNQVKKIIKETVDEYLSDFYAKLSDKERSTLTNSIKAEINKSTSTEVSVLEGIVYDRILSALSKKGIDNIEFEQYIEDKGLKLIKQGNYYFRKKAYEEYANYKKIEFRY